MKSTVQCFISPRKQLFFQWHLRKQTPNSVYAKVTLLVKPPEVFIANHKKLQSKESNRGTVITRLSTFSILSFCSSSGAPSSCSREGLMHTARLCESILLVSALSRMWWRTQTRCCRRTLLAPGSSSSTLSVGCKKEEEKERKRENRKKTLAWLSFISSFSYTD